MVSDRHSPYTGPPDVDWARISRDVAEALLGTPNRKISSRTEWRWGARGSFRLRLESGHWNDFEASSSGGVLELIQRERGVDRYGALDWLRQQGYLPDRQDAVSSPQNAPNCPVPGVAEAAPEPCKTVPTAFPASAETPWFRYCWDSGHPIPSDPNHPARRWMAHRHLWRAEFPVPPFLRWIPAGGPATRKHPGAGSIIVLTALPEAWTAAWPELPAPNGAQTITVAEDGQKCLDKPANEGGVDKRTLSGSAGGSVVIIGCPDLSEALDPVRVAEGLADALAVASRYPGPAVATLSAGAMRRPELAEWLATAPGGVVVHADDDTGKNGRPPAGLPAARDLCRSIEALGGRARAIMPSGGVKDAADAAALMPFGALPEGWAEYGSTLRETTNWPRWEVARAASTTLQEETNDSTQ